MANNPCTPYSGHLKKLKHILKKQRRGLSPFFVFFVNQEGGGLTCDASNAKVYLRTKEENMKIGVSKEFTNFIEAAENVLNAGLSPFFVGDRGIGKSQVAQQIAQKLGKEVYFFNASQADASSLVYPVVDGEVGNKGIELVSLKDVDNKIIIIDELTNARPDLWSFLLSWVLDKKIGNKSFKDIQFIATGNFTKNSTLANSLPRPLLERFCVIEFPVPSVEDWVHHMQQTYPTVPDYYYSFIYTIADINKSYFYEPELDYGDVDDFKQRPSPRSHTQVAKVLASNPNFNTIHGVLSKIEVVRTIMTGFLGSAVYSAFANYINDASNFLSYDDYARGKKPENVPQVINLVMSTRQKFSNILNNENLTQEEAHEYLTKYADRLFGDVYNLDNKLVSLLSYNLITNKVREYFNDGTWIEEHLNSNIVKVIKHRRETYNKAHEVFGL